ncbi:MAG: prolipoprotein diacylglyceryl transferase [Bacteroidetes bacterium]|nr:prolipoprotein diacylglyceryl transferase [Bacteroidota bacterium]
MIEWNVSPIIFSVGPVSIRWYSLMFAISFYLGFLLIRAFMKKDGRPIEDADRVLLYMMVSVIVGARLGHCLFYDPAFYLSHPLEILKVWEGGLASHGAAIGILTGMFIYSRKSKNQPFLWVMDRIVIVVALSGLFIRLGNLFNSEILGIPTDGSWGFVFTRIDLIPRHPVQLYEAFTYFAIFGMLMWMYYKTREILQDGRLFGWFLITVFGGRIILEFFKEEQAAFHMILPITMGQLLSIPFVLAGIYLLVTSKPKIVKLKEKRP